MLYNGLSACYGVGRTLVYKSCVDIVAVCWFQGFHDHLGKRPPLGLITNAYTGLE